MEKIPLQKQSQSSQTSEMGHKNLEIIKVSAKTGGTQPGEQKMSTERALH